MRKVIILPLIMILLVSCSLGKHEPKSDNRFLLDTICIITLYNGEEQKIFNDAFDIIEKEEQIFSLQKDESNLSEINMNAGVKPTIVPENIFNILEVSKYYSKITDGAFDPTIAPLVKLWAIGEDKTETPPLSKEISSRRNLVDSRNLLLQDNNSVFLSEKEMMIDLGGIAKGYIADRVKDYLVLKGVQRAIIDLGGNIVVIGSKADNKPWNIGVRNPFEPPGNYFGVISVVDKTVVTSGIYERFFISNGIRYHHILDPETGYPVVNNLASVTIISDNSVDADALSTSLFILGVDKGLDLIEQIDGSEAIFATKDNKVIYSSGAKDLFTLTDGDFTEIEP